MGKRQQEKFIKLFEKTKDNGELYDGPLDNINFYNLICRAGTCNNLFTWDDIHVCAFKYKYLSNDAILIIVGIPINSNKETSTSKNIAERIMDVIKDSELAFTTLEFTTSTEVKKEKFVYITLLKVI